VSECEQGLIRGEQADRFSVSSEIHRDDHIFDFILNHPYYPTYLRAVEYYFEDGNRSAKKFVRLLRENLDLDRNLDVLEFASGYGCVSRHLVKERDINLWSCDIHSPAVDFLRDSIGVCALQSASLPEMLVLPGSFDAVFALSFFSHMPITTWCRWLVRLAQAVRPGGLLIFTTHGRLSAANAGNPSISDLGFWFHSSSEQKDLPTEQYGTTITTDSFVRKNLLTVPSVELVDWKEGFWWEHQDVYIVRKRSNSDATQLEVVTHRLQAMELSTTWRILAPARNWVHSHPRVARICRRGAKLLR